MQVTRTSNPCSKTIKQGPRKLWWMGGKLSVPDVNMALVNIVNDIWEEEIMILGEVISTLLSQLKRNKLLRRWSNGQVLSFYFGLGSFECHVSILCFWLFQHWSLALYLGPRSCIAGYVEQNQVNFIRFFSMFIILVMLHYIWVLIIFLKENDTVKLLRNIP